MIRILSLLVVCSQLAISSVFAGPEKVSPRLRGYLKPDVVSFNYHKYVQQQEGLLGVASAEAGIPVLIHGDVSRQQLEAMGLTIRTQAGNVFTATIPADAIGPVSDLPGMFRIQAARRYSMHNDIATADADARTEVWGSTAPPFPGNAGAGVVIGDVDSGFDYHHDDFRTAGDLSRFYSIWDQTTGSSPPPGFSIGTLWNKASLDNETATTTDPGSGHGTHVMGTAGGNGRGTDGDEPQYKYAGIAPEATLVGVKTTFFDTAIIDGVNFIFQQAESLGFPAVVNLSLGGQFGPHDGTDPLEIALDALTGPGKVIVASAGNEGGDDIHARGTIAPSGPPASGILEFEYTVGAYSGNAQAGNDFVWFDGWYDSADDYDVTVETPNGFTVGPISLGATSGGAVGTNDGAVEIYNDLVNINGDHNVEIIFWDQFANRRPAVGTWIIRFERVTSTEANIDMWNAVNSSNIPGSFTTLATEKVTIGSPGTANNVITVGAYGTKDSWQSTDGGTYQWGGCPCPSGVIADFSSRGPRRDGAQKPDLSAPGFGVMSTLSDDVNITGQAPLISPDDRHWMNTGTSMSAPVVSGVAALAFVKNPTFGPAEMKAHLITYARSDIITGSVPNDDFGHGRIGGQAGDATDPSVAVTDPNGGEAIDAGSNYAILWNASDNFGGTSGVSGVDISYSDDGGGSWMSIATGEANDGSYSWTVPLATGDSTLVQVAASDPLGNEGTDTSDAVFSITATVGVEDNVLKPVFMLSQSRPNPLTRAARADIQFGLKEDGPARLQVFNSAGRLVTTLADRAFPAGFHRVTWDANGGGGGRVASGQYYYRLETNEGTISRKLLVLK